MINLKKKTIINFKKSLRVDSNYIKRLNRKINLKKIINKYY